ncbi:Alpha-amylase [Sesbania bispinosa]|nr:Alpha-amylase [Sesbania bispinosa]
MQHITTDNISSSMEKPMVISSRKDKNNMIHLDEKSATTPRNKAKIHSHKGKVAPVKNQGREFAKGNQLDFEGGEVEEKFMNTSIGTFENKDQNMLEITL